jgi:hypothetical protein
MSLLTVWRWQSSKEFIYRSVLDLDDRPHNITPILIECSEARTMAFVAMPGPRDATMIILRWRSGRIVGNSYLTGLLKVCSSYGRNRCWLLARANGTWLRGP